MLKIFIFMIIITRDVVKSRDYFQRIRGTECFEKVTYQFTVIRLNSFLPNCEITQNISINNLEVRG